ncbi:Prolipoprotein diacylglyceryl transferase [Haploplasma axanthum]|uniref:Phosphatidylglycerol--prolipoprotein diacylglyceryl transferase n=3 Tax=Haploplasma axanthum TaxID=29552 RepID=A0A449BB68_HAPAX|nr:Prolipoprotein diacylglyceryl transferase [Haploplasma axanthum]
MNNKNDFYNSFRAKFAFFLHPNLGIHLLIVLTLNLITAVTITGLFEISKYPLIKFEIVGFILFIVISTLIEVLTKIFILRYFILIVLKSFATVFLGLQILIFYVTSLLFKEEISFTGSKILSILIFTCSFLLLRTMLIIIYQRYIMKKRWLKENKNMKNWIKKNKLDLSIYFGFIGIILLLVMIAVLPQYKSAVANQRAFNPTAIQIGNFSIQWYAIFIISGIILAATMAYYEFKRIDLNTNDLFDGLLIIVPLAIIGARLYYVLFDPAGKPESFIDVIAIWEGGLAIHGGIIVATIGIIIFSRYKKINVMVLADILALGLLMGQITGRWGNFMNAEAHGGVTDSKFLFNVLPGFVKYQMQFSSYSSNLVGSGSIYQPTFLYESMWNLLGLTILFVIRRMKFLKVGDMIGLYLIWYGFGRGALVEPFRTDQLKEILGVPVNILLSYVLFVGGGVLFLILKRVFNKEEKYYVEVTDYDINSFKGRN